MSNFFIILSLVALLGGLTAHGLMSTDQAAVALVILAILLAIGRGMGTGLAGTVFRVGLPILSIIALGLCYGDGTREGAANIIAAVCTLGFVVFGIYLMVSGPFRR